MIRAFQLIGFLTVATLTLVIGTAILEKAIRALFADIDDAHTDATDEEPVPYYPPEFDRHQPHRTNHPACHICRGIEARADHVWDSLVAQLEGEQA